MPHIEKTLFSVIWTNTAKKYYATESFKRLIEILGPECERVVKIEKHCKIDVNFNESEVIKDE